MQMARAWIKREQQRKKNQGTKTIGWIENMGNGWQFKKGSFSFFFKCCRRKHFTNKILKKHFKSRTYKQRARRQCFRPSLPWCPRAVLVQLRAYDGPVLCNWTRTEQHHFFPAESDPPKEVLHGWLWGKTTVSTPYWGVRWTSEACSSIATLVVLN